MKQNKELKTADVPWKYPIKQDFHVAVYRDEYPVSVGHLLFVPQYNTLGVMNDAFHDAYKFGLDAIKAGEIDGFNIGLNYGKVAGQTIDYPHIHFIPRYEGDVEDPTGGVRNVIPGKGNYKIKI